MSTQVLAALLAARDARCNVDHVQKTASIPAIDNVFTLSCQVAYYAVDTLRCLATAREEDLWSIFGDVISRWTASAPASVMAEKVADERRWITQYRSSHPETDMTPILLKIRRCLCTVDLVYVPFTSVPALATRLSTEPSTLHKTLAFHHRADDKNTIYLSSFLPHLELLLQEGDLAPTTAFKTGFEMDVLVVSIAMAIIHESRHLVGTLLHGAAYRTPYLVQGEFPQDLNDFTHDTDEAGKAGDGYAVVEAWDWFEVSRYGALALPTLVSSTYLATYATTSIRLTGRVEGLKDLRYLHFPVVAAKAAEVRNRQFIRTRRFFHTEYTAKELGSQTSLGELDSALRFNGSPSSSSQPLLRQTTLRAISQTQPTDCEPGRYDHLDIREIGYGNLRGVLRDKPIKKVVSEGQK